MTPTTVTDDWSQASEESDIRRRTCSIDAGGGGSQSTLYENLPTTDEESGSRKQEKQQEEEGQKTKVQRTKKQKEPDYVKIPLPQELFEDDDGKELKKLTKKMGGVAAAERKSKTMVATDDEDDVDVDEEGQEDEEPGAGVFVDARELKGARQSSATHV